MLAKANSLKAHSAELAMLPQEAKAEAEAAPISLAQPSMVSAMQPQDGRDEDKPLGAIPPVAVRVKHITLRTKASIMDEWRWAVMAREAGKQTREARRRRAKPGEPKTQWPSNPE